MIKRLQKRKAVLAATLIAFSMLAFSPPVDASEHASPAAEGDHGVEGGADDALTDEGLNLGEFAFDDFQPTHQATPHIEFSLFAVIDEKAAPAARREMLDWRERMCDQAIIAVRSAEPAALAEPGLDRVRRLIILRLRRLPLPATITDVYLTEFQVENRQ